jgi:ketosteroid isomerase-like protein
VSERNVAVLRTLYAKWEDEAFLDPDDEVYELLDPEIEWDASRRTFDAGVFHGYEGIREFIERLHDVWESGRFEPLEFIPAGDEVVVPVRLVLVSRTDHQPVTANAAHVWTLRDGRVTRHCVFQSKAEALAAVGASH